MPLTQYCSVAGLQFSHSRHESTKQPTPTRSPTAYLVTPGPTSATMPAISWPGTIGKIGVAPPLAGLVDVGVADAGELDLDQHVVLADRSRRSIVVRSSGALEPARHKQQLCSQRSFSS